LILRLVRKCLLEKILGWGVLEIFTVGLWGLRELRDDAMQSGENFPNFRRNVTSQYNKEVVFTSETKHLYQTTRSDVPETIILKKA
jgi:hypothetical protein